MQSNEQVDTEVLKLLAQIPVYREWHNPPLDDQSQAFLHQANEQQLMSVGVQLLRQLIQKTTAPPLKESPVRRSA